MSKKNSISARSSGVKHDPMDKGPLGDRYNSDNAFNDQGLKNAELTEKAVNKKNR